MTKYLSLFLIVFLCSFAIKESPLPVATIAPSQISNVDTLLLYQDTLRQLEMRSIRLDSMEEAHFYEHNKSNHLVYHAYGKVETPEQSYGISLYSTPYDEIIVRLLKKEKNKWSLADSIILYDIRFSPAYFSAHYDDYNQDGTNDLYLIFYNSMSVAYSYGQLIIVSNTNERLIPIKETLEIPNLFVNEGRIESITYNHPGHERTQYKKTELYVIEKDSLILKRMVKDYL